MDISQIRIQSEQGQIGMSHSRPHMQIRQHNAVMEIDQKLAGNLSISRTASKLFIDQSEAFADANLKSPLRMASEWSAGGKQRALQYAAKKAQEGEQLKAIENGVNMLPRVAKNHSDPPAKEINLGYMPKNMSRVRFTYQPSEIKVDSAWPDPSIRFHIQKPELSAPPWEVNVYMKKNPSITMDVVPSLINRHV
ncbi:DUF6470 family protein [Alteribacter keqinensis]|uniref:Uncharacterized protein n=1 Tax=Alteribacter keqinensis TaxID=2483800 RepID=A0A3M7TPK2_9BACI|nr:DUF6470 family protein [Alteribacter keqinensis]RNA67566.1 hypothetical protein EBO34_12625 [Alteribacter keqinensis]